MRLDVVKHRLASCVSDELTAYGIPLEIGEIEVRSINDVRLKNVLLLDLSGDTIMYADEARAYLQTEKLLKGEVRVNTLVFAAPDIRLSRETPDSDLNIQFIVDILNNNKKDEPSKLDLRINQLLLYDGRLSYDVFSEVPDCSKFDPNHVSIGDLACNLSLKKLRKDELDVYIRSISGRERCGLELEKLKAHVAKQGGQVCLSNFELRTPLSELESDKFEITADSAWNNLSFSGSLESDCLDPADVAPFVSLPGLSISPFSFSVDGFYSKDTLNAAVTAQAFDNSFSIMADVEAASPFV